MLIVNVASRCGFPAVRGSAYQRGLLAKLAFCFPCNDFGAQEPALEEIKSFCSTTYSADFELFEKVHAGATPQSPTPRSIR